MTELSFCVVLKRHLVCIIQWLSGRSWPSFYLVINEVKSGSIRMPLEDVRNQTLANLLHSFKVQMFSNVLGLFRFKRIFFTLLPASKSWVRIWHVQRPENHHFMHFSNFLNFRPLNNSLEPWIIFSWISLPKGIFWQNKKKFDFLWVSFDSRFSQKMALKGLDWRSVIQKLYWLELKQTPVKVILEARLHIYVWIIMKTRISLETAAREM